MELKDFETIIDNYCKIRCDHRRRYASYDFCHYYFYQNRGNLKSQMEYSCLHLWSYLASWGMLRGSGQLIKKSPASLVPLINHINDNAQSKLWEIDFDTYTDENIQILVEEYKEIKKILKDIITRTPSVVLITKIMLGVYGNIPAFDHYFTETFQGEFRSVNKKPLKLKEKLNLFKDIYNKNQTLFKKRINIVDFINGNETDLIYSKAKLLDMYGFQKAMEKEINEKKVKRKRKERKK